MPDYLMSIPNELFYNNRIKYGGHQEKGYFIDDQRPLIFINVDGEEELIQPSYFNY